MALKFGLLPGVIPVGLRDLTYYRAGNLPTPPPKVEVPSVPEQPDGTAWGLEGNDTYGDCVFAGFDHGLMVSAALTGSYAAESWPADSAVVGYYLTYTGGEDDGAVISQALAYFKARGFLGHTLKAYAPVGVHDIPTLHFAIDAYGFAYTGIKVTSGMMSSFNAGKPWDLDDLLSETEGGHCVPLAGYDSQHLYCITWGKVQPITYAAWHYMSSEAWACITGEFAAKGGDGRGINLAALEADLPQLAA